MKKHYLLKLVMSVLLIVTSIQIGVAQDTTPPTVVAKDFTAQLDVTGNVTVSQSDIISSITDDVTLNPTVTLSNTIFNCNDIITSSWEHKNTSISGNYEKSAFYSDVSGIYMVGYNVALANVDLLKWNASDWEVVSTLDTELTPNFLNLSRHSNGTFLINIIDQGNVLNLFKYDSVTPAWSELISATANPQWNFSSTYDVANFATNPINGDIWMSFVPYISDGGTYAPNVLKYDGTTLSLVGYPRTGITDEWANNCDITFTADGNASVIFGARNNPVGPFVVSYNGIDWFSRGVINGIQGRNYNNNIITSDTNEVFISFRDATSNLSHLIKTSDFVTWENLRSADASDITSLSKLSAGKIYYRFSNNGYLVDGSSVVDITEPEYDLLINAKLVLNPEGEYLLFGNYNYGSTRTYKYNNGKTISYVVTDEAGNETSGSVVITVKDNLAPTVITQNISVSLDATGNVSILPAAIDNNSTDACGISAYTLNITDFTCANLGANTVTLSVADKYGNSTSAEATVTVLPGDLAPVATSEFGNNEWKVYTYINTPTYCIPYTNYAGYYVEPNLSFRTSTRWNQGGSPSEASGYIGDVVPSDNHSFAAKRKGFPVGYYSIDIPGHDDDATLFVNGVEVFKHLGCCDQHYKVWEGVLDTNSTVDYRILEGGGGSYGNITFNLVPLAINTVVANFSSSSCETTVTVTASGGIPPYTGEGVFTVGSGLYTYSVFDSLGAEANASVIVKDDSKPVVITKNISVTLDSNGQAIVTPAMIDNSSTDNCGITSYQVATGTPISPKIYFTGTNGVIWSANRDGTGTPTVLYNYRDENMRTAVGIEANLDNSNLYFAGAGNRNIYNATLDGVGTIETIPNTSANCNQHDLEIDWEANKLFYTDSCNGVYLTTIDGAEPATQIGTYSAVALTYDKTNQKIYYVNPNGPIGVVDADGANENPNLFSANSPRGITINEATGRLFWVEKDSKEIYTALVDGSEAPHVLYSFAVDDRFVDYAYGIDFDPNTNTLFWTAFGNQFDDTVYSAPADGSGIPQVLFVGNYGSIRGIAAGRNINGVYLNSSTNNITYTAADVGTQKLYLIGIDANGNKSSAEAIVTVIPAPFSISCPENIAKYTDSGVCTASVVVGNPTLSDLEGLSTLTWDMTGATIGNSEATGINYAGTLIFNSGVTTITYTATDSNETVVECSFTVAVTDTESPIVITKNTTIALDSNGQTTLIPSQIDNVSTDNCGITSYKLTKASALSPFIYFTGVTDGKIWRANRDGSGTPELLNAASAGAVGIEVNYENGKIYYATSTTNKIQTQPLSGLGVSVAVPNTDQGNNKHDFEYDWAGNRIFYTTNSGGIYVKSIDGLSTPIQLVSDAQVVTLTFDKTNQKIYYGNLSGFIGVVNADGTGKNNTLFVASPKGITINEATGRLFWVEQSLKKIYTALIDGSEAPHELYSTGASGNPFGIDYDSTTDNLYWTVFNSGEKIVSAPANGVGTPVTLFSGSYGGLRGIAAGRNIKGNDLSSATSSLSFDCNELGNNTIYLVAIDEAGNTSANTATVVIEDTSLPIAIAQDLQVQLDSSGNATLTSDQINNGSNDNCSINLMSLSQYNFTNSDIGIKTITLTITDSSGNVSTATSQVTISGSLGTPNQKNNLFVIYPVPFDDFINITLPNSYLENEVYIRVYDLTGKAVYSQKHIVTNNKITINTLSNYRDGAYFITLSNKKNELIQTRQILKKAN